MAVISPSFAAPGLFPRVHAVAMHRLREQFGLVPVEFPTTQQLGAPPEDRSRDFMAAFADPRIRAVLASIGGDDQITVLPFLDPEVVLADPKPFVGYSDNTSRASAAGSTFSARAKPWITFGTGTPMSGCRSASPHPHRFQHAMRPVHAFVLPAALGQGCTPPPWLRCQHRRTATRLRG